MTAFRLEGTEERSGGLPGEGALSYFEVCMLDRRYAGSVSAEASCAKALGHTRARCLRSEGRPGRLEGGGGPWDLSPRTVGNNVCSPPGPWHPFQGPSRRTEGRRKGRKLINDKTSPVFTHGGPGRRGARPERRRGGAANCSVSGPLRNQQAVGVPTGAGARGNLRRTAETYGWDSETQDGVREPQA